MRASRRERLKSRAPSNWVLAVVLLSLARAQAADSAPEGSLPAANELQAWHWLTRLEARTLAVLPQGGSAAQGYAELEPRLVVDGGPGWGLHLGAPVRVRLWGAAADAGRVRRQDWDSLSDWGQLVRLLRLGGDSSPLVVRVGALEDYTLLSGHLVRRYSNRTQPDAHPAGGLLTVTLGPLYAEAFTSDVLGARLMGVQAEVDLEDAFSSALREPGRYTLGLSVARDWGGARGGSPGVTLAHVDGTAVLVGGPAFELHLLGGWGSRPATPAAWGAVVGLGADALTATVDMKLRVELRRQHGGFRQGYFGAGYELLSGSREPFPEGFSAYGEVVLGWDREWLGELVHRHLHLSLGVEVFAWGRVDVDGRLALQLAGRSVELAVAGLGQGLGQLSSLRLYSAEVRWRFSSILYALAQGGVRLYPEDDGRLRPVAFTCLGLGVEQAR